MEKGIPTWWARNLFIGPLLFPLPTRAQPKPPPAAHPSLLHRRAGPPGQEPCARPIPTDVQARVVRRFSAVNSSVNQSALDPWDLNKSSPKISDDCCNHLNHPWHHHACS
jgi:hypothetical protein